MWLKNFFSALVWGLFHKPDVIIWLVAILLAIGLLILFFLMLGFVVSYAEQGIRKQTATLEKRRRNKYLLIVIAEIITLSFLLFLLVEPHMS